MREDGDGEWELRCAGELEPITAAVRDMMPSGMAQRRSSPNMSPSTAEHVPDTRFRAKSRSACHRPFPNPFPVLEKKNEKGGGNGETTDEGGREEK